MAQASPSASPCVSKLGPQLFSLSALSALPSHPLTFCFSVGCSQPLLPPFILTQKGTLLSPQTETWTYCIPSPQHTPSWPLFPVSRAGPGRWLKFQRSGEKGECLLATVVYVELQSGYKNNVSERILQVKAEQCVQSVREPRGTGSCQSKWMGGGGGDKCVWQGMWVLLVLMHAKANRGQTSPNFSMWNHLISLSTLITYWSFLAQIFQIHPVLRNLQLQQ